MNLQAGANPAEPGAAGTSTPQYASTPLPHRVPTTAGVVGSPWHPPTTATPQYLGQSPVVGSPFLRGAAAAAPAAGVLGRPAAGPEVLYSPRLMGLIAYFSRLVG